MSRVARSEYHGHLSPLAVACALRRDVWVVGQGGFGIKTARPLARWVAGLVAGAGPPADLTDVGLRAGSLDPARFR